MSSSSVVRRKQESALNTDESELKSILWEGKGKREKGGECHHLEGKEEARDGGRKESLRDVPD